MAACYGLGPLLHCRPPGESPTSPGKRAADGAGAFLKRRPRTLRQKDWQAQAEKLAFPCWREVAFHARPTEGASGRDSEVEAVNLSGKADSGARIEYTIG